jgi:predicted nucleotide-binding protein
MDDIKIAFAKLAGILKAVRTLLDERSGRAARPIENFAPRDIGENFKLAEKQVALLREHLPTLYGDFPQLQIVPSLPMFPGTPEPNWYSRDQLAALARDIEQIFETRAHSELAAPEPTPREARVFLSHGRAADWREVQAYIEHDVGLRTLELAQEPNLGRTVLQKLEQESQKCTSAVIVMTGDDADAEGNLRARENVLHEVGYFQARYGLRAVCLLHEEGVGLPSNIHGLVYIPFTRGQVPSTFGVLNRELKAFYSL